MRVLIACEFSGVVRDAFIARGHDAVSCDLLPTERPGPHYQQDIRNLLQGVGAVGWDLMIAFPPCTYLARSGARWWPERYIEQEAAIRFARWLMDVPIDHIALENPVGILSSRYREPDQVIQPWMFGHGETKATCLWLKNLPVLRPTEYVSGREPRVHYEAPGPERAKNRSRTLAGIAEAMAQQWGVLLPVQARMEAIA